MKNNILKIALFLTFPLWVISCEDQESEDHSLLRTFTPINFSQSVIENTVTFKWVPIADVTYLLEISRDSLAFERDLQSFSLTKINEYYIENLWNGERYSARIKAINNNPEIPDSKFKSITFKMGSENLITGNIASYNKITLSWDESVSGVNRIVASAKGFEDVAVTLSGEDQAARQKEITGLEPGTSYTVRIYLGERLRGTVTVTTLNVFTAVASGDITAYRITLKWNKTENVDRMVMSTAADNTALILTPEEIAAGQKVIDDLTPETVYTFRIYLGESIKGVISAKTNVENIFTTVASGDINADRITLKWDRTRAADRIVVAAAGVADVTINLSPEEIAAGQKLVDGLMPGIEYTFRIYLGETLRGTTTAKTKTAP